jgi:hypothetical protein
LTPKEAFEALRMTVSASKTGAFYRPDDAPQHDRAHQSFPSFNFSAG